ncbi:Hydroxyproline-rich glycoprotein family protein, putative isoform 2 [Hibiscus syriacus]|uniref:Hydroxyproline-rich glycoprotein family protein, putative isoform 2 n=1 Tax=Hibiscus syriacus TaxID=106335 RepID=A0A6A2XBC8_HIBSY|nr:Hydroxyproline-rich glycoprotein family protein, putative isoform 2 [Hibiscus syriacus]
MQSGNVVSSDKMQFSAPPAGAGAVGDAGGGGAAAAFGGEIQQQHQCSPDKNDGFIHWLCGEFAAVNAMTDLLCHHLLEIAEVGEYDAVIASIQQRRHSWNPVLHMQPYFPVTDVSYALQQAAWRRRQRLHDQRKVAGKEYKRPTIGFKGNRVDLAAKEMQNPMADSDVKSTVSERNDRVAAKGVGVKSSGEVGNVEDKSESEGFWVLILLSLELFTTLSVTPILVLDPYLRMENNLHSSQNQNRKQNLTMSPKTFVGNEVFDGNMVNVVDGLKLYEELFDEEEVLNLVSLEFDPWELLVVSLVMFSTLKSPTIIDRRMEAIPTLLQDVIERLVDLQVMTAKPNSCIVDVYNEGDHLLPRMWPPWFGKPVCLLFLTECNITFGRVIAVDHPGDFQGSLKLSLSPGSLLVMEGKSACFAKHALPSVRKQRILVTFTKYQPRKFASDNRRHPLPSLSQSSHQGVARNKSHNHFRPAAVPKHYAVVPTTGVLPVPPIHPHIPHPNGVQPFFVPAPIVPAIPFPAPVPIPTGMTAWPAPPPRHPPPHLPVVGTRVFLPPPGFDNSSPELNIPVGATSPPEKENDPQKPDLHTTAPGTSSDGKSRNQDRASSG